MAIIVTTTAPKQFLYNLLTRENIVAKNIIEANINTTFSVGDKDFSRLTQTFKKANVKFEIVRDNSIKNRILLSVKRIGLIAGLMIFIISVTVYATATLKVEIVGNTIISTENIMTKINESGVITPSILTSYNCKDIKNTVLNIDGVSAVSVERKGSRIVVNILEEIPKVAIIDTQNHNNIVSKYNSIITKVVSIKGTPVVKIGDTVKVNDTLIAPHIVGLDDKLIASPAVGEVFGRVWFTSNLLYPDTVITAVRTGETEVLTDIEIFGIRSNKKCSYSSYQVESSSASYMALLPFKTHKNIYYRTREEQTSFDFDANKERLVEKGYNELEKTLPADGKVLRKWFLIKRLDKMTQLSIYYEVDISLGKICQ